MPPCRRITGKRYATMSSVQAFIAANRFGFGARPGELAVIARDPMGWALAQLDARHVPQPALQKLPSTAEALRDGLGLLQRAKQSKNSGDADAQRKMLRETVKTLRDDYAEEAAARTQLAIQSAAPFFERLVQFWSNHFTVSATKRQSLTLVAAFERDAIRPHVMGNFADLLLASSRHPAMLVYLDNARSIGPNSPAGKRRNKGLNENLAREILELHSLGVHGGYTQEDVIALAKMLTGWTADANGTGDGSGFLFMNLLHEPGPKKLFGKTYRAGGVQEAEAALRDLARHPSAAAFVATKLARHFVADDPPAAVIRTLQNAYLRSGGDLRPVYKTLIALPEIWQAPLGKIKTPNDYIISLLRASGMTADIRLLAQAYQSLNQIPFSAPSPAGWSDRGADWIGGEALLRRIELAESVARAVHTTLDPQSVFAETIAPVASESTRQAVRRAGSRAEALTLLFSSPEFQRR